MKLSNIFLYITASSLLIGCGTVRMQITDMPKNLSEDSRKIDDLQCSAASRDTGYVPLLFGLGQLVARDMSVKLYTECMEKKGYKVQKAD